MKFFLPEVKLELIKSRGLLAPPGMLGSVGGLGGLGGEGGDGGEGGVGGGGLLNPEGGGGICECAPNTGG